MSDYYDSPSADFSDLVGKTIVAIKGADAQSERITFVCSDGSAYVMRHSQDCCESVYVESVTGDVSDLIGTPILRAEESTSEQTPAGYTHEWEPESQTWTFYKLATVRGWVDIRWFGSSNGWYSESVNFARTSEPQEARNA